MLKIISAALFAASMLAVAPAMAHGPGRTAHAPGVGIHVSPSVFGANARMGRHHHHRHHHKHVRHHHRFHGHR